MEESSCCLCKNKFVWNNEPYICYASGKLVCRSCKEFRVENFPQEGCVLCFNENCVLEAERNIAAALQHTCFVHQLKKLTKFCNNHKCVHCDDCSSHDGCSKLDYGSQLGSNNLKKEAKNQNIDSITDDNLNELNKILGEFKIFCKGMIDSIKSEIKEIYCEADNFKNTIIKYSETIKAYNPTQYVEKLNMRNAYIEKIYGLDTLLKQKKENFSTYLKKSRFITAPVSGNKNDLIAATYSAFNVLPSRESDILRFQITNKNTYKINSVMVSRSRSENTTGNIKFLKIYVNSSNNEIVLSLENIKVSPSSGEHYQKIDPNCQYIFHAGEDYIIEYAYEGDEPYIAYKYNIKKSLPYLIGMMDLNKDYRGIIFGFGLTIVN